MKSKSQASSSPSSGKATHPKLKKIKWKPSKSASSPNDADTAASQDDPLREEREARAQAHTILKAWLETDRESFNNYVKHNPPEPLVIDHLVSLALNTNHPDRGHRLAKVKAAKVYGPAKTEVLAEWKEYRASPKYKSKNHFSLHLAKSLKDANGKAIRMSTILGWLPKLK